jgi:hypothetical protein
LLINNSVSPLKIGRFKLLNPGDVLPDVLYTKPEQIDIARLLAKGILKRVRSEEDLTTVIEEILQEVPVPAEEPEPEVEVEVIVEEVTPEEDDTPEEPMVEDTLEELEEDDTPEEPMVEDTPEEDAPLDMVETDDIDLSSMTKDQLNDYAQSLGIDLDMRKRVNTLRSELAETLGIE